MTSVKTARDLFAALCVVLIFALPIAHEFQLFSH
jgi:hypothetical protein